MSRTRKPYRLWNRDGIFYYRLKNVPGWKSTGTRTLTDALNVVAAVLGERPQPTISKKLKIRMTLREYLEPFYTARCPHATRLETEGRSMSPVHLRAMRSLLVRKVLPDPIADLRLEELRRGHLLDFRDRLRASCGPRTVNRVMQGLKTALKEGLFREELTYDPSAGIGQVRYEKRISGTFTLEEIRAMFGGCPGPWREEAAYTAFLVLYSLGLRRNEMLGLRWGSIDFEAGTVSIHEALNDTGGLKLPKWGRKRAVPLPAFTAMALKAHRARSSFVLPTAFVFNNELGEAHRPGWAYTRFQACMKALKINTEARSLRIHSFRHSAQTHLAAQGYNFELARAAFGWTDEKVQRDYTHLAGADLQGQAEIIDRLLR